MDFLSLYAVTQSGAANGTWANLPFKYTTSLTLFGSGVQNRQQLIQNVWIGTTSHGNPYNDINAALSQLGFYKVNGLNHAPYSGHESHFHVDLRVSARVLITDTHKLLASSTVSKQTMPVASDVLMANAQSLLDQVKTDLNLTQGEVTMITMNTPNVPPQNAPVMIAQANQAYNVAKIRTFGVCQPVPSVLYNGDNVLSPVTAAQIYLYNYEHHSTATGPATVTILQKPKHGILRLVTEVDRGTLFDSSAGSSDPNDPAYAYLPERGFGKDKAAFLVDFGGGIKVKVVIFFLQHEGPLGDTEWGDVCNKTGTMWKISSTLDANGNSTLTAVDYLPYLTGDNTSATNATLASVLGKGLASSLDANTSGITLNIADLPGGAVGETTGTNITLDTHAAGYGWYVDPNPAANTDFLPTSDPNVWMAKPGSAAAGKMDMLSVLLHEYGHALGLDHSANPNDFMAPNLQPGERRLPSATELAQLSQLATQLASGNSTPNSPATPALPMGASLSALLIGRLRRTDYGAATALVDSVQIPAPAPQFAKPRRARIKHS